MEIVKKILDNGLWWTIDRIVLEFRSPTFRYMKVLMNAVHSVKQFFTGCVVSENQVTTNDELVAVYDLRMESITYDFAFFISSAESFMIKNKKKTFVVYIIKEKNFSSEDSLYAAVVDNASLRWRFENIIIPLISAYSACSGYSILPVDSIDVLLKNRLVYPDMYDGKYYMPSMDYRDVFDLLNTYGFTGFSASQQGISYIELWLKERGYRADKLVTITIRSYGYDESRNSNVNDWVRFSEWLEKIGYIPVFILDTDASFLLDNRFDNCTIFREICWNIGLRVALYEVAYLNYVSAGPASVAQLNKKARYISMNLIVDGSLQAKKDVFETYGLQVEKDKRYAFAGKHQILSWKEDVFENIVEEFNEFKKL